MITSVHRFALALRPGQPSSTATAARFPFRRSRTTASSRAVAASSPKPRASSASASVRSACTWSSTRSLVVTSSRPRLAAISASAADPRSSRARELIRLRRTRIWRSRTAGDTSNTSASRRNSCTRSWAPTAAHNSLSSCETHQGHRARSGCLGYRSKIGRSTSGSCVSPSVVEPTRSQNTAVTVLRDSPAATDGPSDVPHPLQNLAPSGFAFPQFEQTSTADAIPRTGPPCGWDDRSHPRQRSPGQDRRLP